MLRGAVRGWGSSPLAAHGVRRGPTREARQAVLGGAPGFGTRGVLCQSLLCIDAAKAALILRGMGQGKLGAQGLTEGSWAVRSL